MWGLKCLLLGQSLPLSLGNPYRPGGDGLGGAALRTVECLTIEQDVRTIAVVALRAGCRSPLVLFHFACPTSGCPVF